MKFKKIILIIVKLAGLLALGSLLLSGVALHPKLSSTKFCLSCHEMNTPYEEYQKSVHYMNPSGVRAECSSCHMPPTIVPKMVRKIKSLNQVYGHLTGVLDTKAKFGKERARMAEMVWADMKANDSQECRSCHNQEGFVLAEFNNPKKAERMKEGLAENQTCIDCHKGVVHKMPDMSSSYKRLYEALKISSKDPKIKAKTVYPLGITICYDKRDGKREGRVLPATRLSVLEKKGKWLKVRIDGWRQDGVEAMIYELQGKRIFSVALDKGAREKPITKSTMVDPKTEQTWHHVNYTTWVMTAGIVEELSKLWTYGEKMRTSSCGTCHRPIQAKHFLANQWIGTMKDMKRYVKKLNKEQYLFLQKYFQLHAKDVVEAAH